MARLTGKQARELGVEPRGQSPRRHRDGAMNRTEAAYADHLWQQQVTGEIAWYAFEPIKLRLADRSWYSPDFLVMLPNGVLQLHEVKGRKGSGYYATEDSRLKVRFAAEQYPFSVVVAWPRKKSDGGGWDTEVFGVSEPAEQEDGE